MTMQLHSDPHALQPLLRAGPPPEQAEATVVLLHGRGASAESMLSLYGQLILPTIAALAPQAAGSTWYPHSFLAPIEANQPFLDSALNRIEFLWVIYLREKFRVIELHYSDSRKGPVSPRNSLRVIHAVMRR